MLYRGFFIVLLKMVLSKATPAYNFEPMRRMAPDNSTFIGEFVIGKVWWFWMPPITVFGAFVGLFMAWFLSSESRNEEMDKLLETMMARAGIQKKKASQMNDQDVMMITEHWNTLTTLKMKEASYVDEISVTVETSSEATTPYEVLEKTFKHANMYGKPVLDETDFEMALGLLGIAPHELDIPHVFHRLNKGSDSVSVDAMFEAIEDNIETPEWPEGLNSILKAAILKTYSRERRASLSILKNHDEALQTEDMYNSGNTGYNSSFGASTIRGNVEMLIRAKTAQTAIGLSTQDLLQPREFNKLLVSMGVTFSEAYVKKRVLYYELLRPDGIDALEFQELLHEQIENNPGKSKNDAVAEVLDILIERYGGEELAEKRHAEDVAMERNGAFTTIREKFLDTPDESKSSGAGDEVLVVNPEKDDILTVQ